MSAPSDRSRAWASTMAGHAGTDGVVTAHADAEPRVVPRPPRGREVREELEEALLQPAATRAFGAGQRARAEEPDPERTCFERDRDRVLHSAAFRRLAGKTQVFVHPADHQRTRLTHALEVAQVATSVARGCGLNVALTEAIAIGHDCGHGPGGHASEEAFDAFLPGGYDHAVWGADVVLVPLNLCVQTLDGIRNHSWSRPAPTTPEGVVVSWADRIAYTAHDLEDAVHAGIVGPDDLPDDVAAVCGRTRRAQLGTFVGELVRTTTSTGVIGMAAEPAQALAALRSFNYERIYTRPEALAQSAAVVKVLRALVEHYVERPQTLPRDFQLPDDAVRAAVTYVGGMTDRYAFRTAVELLGWPDDQLPAGIDIPRPR
ncbi:deoxyguanosinetriphosphate triphosphohydrolase [Angustibacter peucedani]